VASPLRAQARPAAVLSGSETILLVEDENAVRTMTRLGVNSLHKPFFPYALAVKVRTILDARPRNGRN
jgi:hypothetical protein